jgi:hypothetical protein
LEKGQRYWRDIYFFEEENNVLEGKNFVEARRFIWGVGKKSGWTLQARKKSLIGCEV